VDDVRPGTLLRGPHRDWRWWTGLALAAYGVAGLLLLAVAAIGLARPLEQLGALGGAVETERRSLVSTLRETSQTLADAGVGFGGFGESLAQARQSTDRAAALARDVSSTMSGIARASEVTVLGVQPLAQLAPQFDRAALQLQQLGTDMDGIGTAMTRNSADVEKARADIGRIRVQVEALASAAEATGIPAGTPAELSIMRLALYALIAWLALLALASVTGGLALLRASRAASD
jgi:hypothetical protein